MDTPAGLKWRVGSGLLCLLLSGSAPHPTAATLQPLSLSLVGMGAHVSADDSSTCMGNIHNVWMDTFGMDIYMYMCLTFIHIIFKCEKNIILRLN